jgi:hypothetical protein
VKEGIELALNGLLDLTHPANGTPSTRSNYEYMWSHERDAVRWVELGKDKLAQFAADVVLLSNMTYRLREHSVARANEAAVSDELPLCIQKSSLRERIDHHCNGECALKLCQSELGQAVLNARAPFSAGFCRDQARLVGQNGAPRWTRISYRRKSHLKTFWDDQANLVQSAHSR